jgi:hypothetical protein
MNINNYVGDWIYNEDKFKALTLERLIEDLNVLEVAPYEFDYSFIQMLKAGAIALSMTKEDIILSLLGAREF